MIQLKPMTCRDCGTSIPPSMGHVPQRKAASCYMACYYRCPGCAIAYTNARDEAMRTKIYPDCTLNVPAEVRDGLTAVLDGALNVINRPGKKDKFAFETSEDALTWTVFRYLLQKRQLGEALGLSSIQGGSVLFWRSPWPTNTDSPVQNALLEILHDRIKERQLTEPDVVLVGERRIVFIEVKYNSPNPRQPDYPSFDRYLIHGTGLFNVPLDDVKRAGYYELTRNWIIGNLLASSIGAEFILVNLADRTCAQSGEEFARLLATGPQRFVFVAWPDLVARIPRPLEEWFGGYLAQRGLMKPEDGAR